MKTVVLVVSTLLAMGFTCASSVAATFPPDEDFDAVAAPALPSGWTTSTTDSWITTTTVADSAPNSAYAPNLPTHSDFTLDSPAFTPTGTTTLIFRQRYNLEPGYDGAVLEISIDGAAFQDILAAGGAFVAEGYGALISPDFGSELANRLAWTGDSAGFVTTVVTLPATSTGHPTRLRFRTADDSIFAPSTSGWWVDSIHLAFATLPTLDAACWPADVQVSADSRLDVTLGNPTLTPATLTADLVDTLPSGLIATASSATTTCSGGAGASNTSGALTLAFGAVIPANASCTLSVRVHADSVGTYSNTIASAALQTTIGNSDAPADASLTVSAPPIAVIPSELALTVVTGTTGSTPLHIGNIGGGDLVYSMSESAVQRPSASTDERLISQMADATPDGEALSCAGFDATSPNSWWRRYYFNEYPGVGAQTNVTAVTISSGPSMVPDHVPVTINLYTLAHSTPVDTIPTTNLTLIGTATATIGSGLDSLTIPVFGQIADTANDDLVVEYHVDEILDGGFHPGANTTPETHTAFLSSANCGVDEPTPIVDVSPETANFHLTMVVDVGGALPASCTNASDVPWLSASPPTGSVAAGGIAEVTINANAANLVEGSYSANVCVGSNDPMLPLATVPVTLDVTQLPFVLCPGNAEEVFCSGFELHAGVFTDRTAFLTHVAAGRFDNPFNDAQPGPSPPLHYVQGGWEYTLDTTTPIEDGGGLFLSDGVVSTGNPTDSIIVTFSGDPITAVGGNFWVTDFQIGTDMTVTLSDGTTETFASNAETDFRGFTTLAPITSISINAVNQGPPIWPILDNLVVGSAR
jgi:hypothetical protein